MNNEIYETIPMRIGDTLPEIELHAFHEGKEVRLQTTDYEGKWMVFFFYPADFTFVCPTELEELADNYEVFKEMNTEIFSVSTDTVFTHKAWKDNSPTIGKVQFPMVADTNGSLSKLFGTYIHEEGLSLRGTFIISPEGELIAMEINNNDIGRSVKELIRKIQAAQFVREHDGQVCPANWQPGDDTLEPGMDLVGEL